MAGAVGERPSPSAPAREDFDVKQLANAPDGVRPVAYSDTLAASSAESPCGVSIVKRPQAGTFSCIHTGASFQRGLCGALIRGAQP